MKLVIVFDSGAKIEFPMNQIALKNVNVEVLKSSNKLLDLSYKEGLYGLLYIDQSKVVCVSVVD